MTPREAAEAMREAILKTLADTFGLSPLGSLFKCIREIRLPALPENVDADGREATERRSGHSKLVYDKNKRAIVAIDPRDAEIATLRAQLSVANDGCDARDALVQSQAEDIATLRAALESLVDSGNLSPDRFERARAAIAKTKEAARP